MKKNSFIHDKFVSNISISYVNILSEKPKTFLKDLKSIYILKTINSQILFIKKDKKE